MNEHNGSLESAPKALARDMGEFAHDVYTLVELQAQLFAADTRECSQRAFVPGLVLLCGAALGFACFPIALAAIGLLISHVFEISYAAGFLTALMVGATLSFLLCAIGWSQIRGRMTVMRRSQQELVRNLRWLKKVLERKRITRSNSIDKSWRTIL